MGIITWIIFGALAGWVASMIAGTNDRQGCLTNIVIGVLGAFIGGFVVEFLTDKQFIIGWNVRSFVVAVLGSVALLAVTGWGRRRREG